MSHQDTPSSTPVQIDNVAAENSLAQFWRVNGIVDNASWAAFVAARTDAQVAQLMRQLFTAWFRVGSVG